MKNQQTINYSALLDRVLQLTKRKYCNDACWWRLRYFAKLALMVQHSNVVLTYHLYFMLESRLFWNKHKTIKQQTTFNKIKLYLIYVCIEPLSMIVVKGYASKFSENFWLSFSLKIVFNSFQFIAPIKGFYELDQVFIISNKRCTS